MSQAKYDRPDSKAASSALRTLLAYLAAKPPTQRDHKQYRPRNRSRKEITSINRQFIKLIQLVHTTNWCHSWCIKVFSKERTHRYLAQLNLPQNHVSLLTKRDLQTYHTKEPRLCLHVSDSHGASTLAIEVHIFQMKTDLITGPLTVPKFLISHSYFLLVG